MDVNKSLRFSKEMLKETRTTSLKMTFYVVSELRVLRDSARTTEQQRNRTTGSQQNYVDDAKLGMAADYATGDCTLQAIADTFGARYSTVSRAVSGT